MTLLVFLIPAIGLFALFCLVLFIDFYMRFCQWLSALASFSFGVSVSPNTHNLNNQYGMGGMLSQYGEAKIKRLTKNCLSFDVKKEGNDFECYISSYDTSNIPYNHLIMRIKRHNGLYPISIETISKDYFDIHNDQSLKIALDEILESSEVVSVIDSAMYVFWSKYNNSAELDSSPLPEVEAKEYKNLMKLRNNNNLKNNKDRLRLVEICQKLLPPLGEKVLASELTDLEKLSLVRK